jgi:hypothetical protein
MELFEETDAQHVYPHDNLLEQHIMGHVCNIRKPKKELDFNYIGLIKSKFLPEYPPMWMETESSTAVYYRMLAAILMINQIYKEHDDVTIAIVGHKNAIGCLTRKPLDNCGFVAMTLDEILNAKDE